MNDIYIYEFRTLNILSEDEQLEILRNIKRRDLKRVENK